MYAATSNWRVAGTSAARERYAGNSLTMLEMSRFDKTWGGVAVCVRVHTIEPKTRCNGWEIIACVYQTGRTGSGRLWYASRAWRGVRNVRANLVASCQREDRPRQPAAESSCGLLRRLRPRDDFRAEPFWKSRTSRPEAARNHEIADIFASPPAGPYCTKVYVQLGPPQIVKNIVRNSGSGQVSIGEVICGYLSSTEVARTCR